MLGIYYKKNASIKRLVIYILIGTDDSYMHLWNCGNSTIS
jgi:hypothetical protein